MATESKFIRDFKAARMSGVPLLAIETSEPISCMKQIKTSGKQQAPIISWDASEGFQPRNEEGEAVLTSVFGGEKDDWAITDLNQALRKAQDFPGKKKAGDGIVGGTILFIMNGHLFIGSQNEDQIKATQALWNLRDVYKKDFRMLVILCPSIVVPEEVKHDIVILEEPLPTTSELENIVKGLYKSAGVEGPDAKSLLDGVEAVRGLSSFEAETVVAMSLQKEGLDLERLWERKRKAIQGPGMRAWRGIETYEDVRGVLEMKDYLTKVMEGEEAPTVLVFWDEVEKAFAGTQGDLSGVTQEMHGMTLSWMADNDVLAVRYVGHPGCSKSYIAKATAGQFKKPLVIMNMSELKGGIVGQSTSQLRAAFKMISAIGRPLVLATCNSDEALSAELKDRFNLGTFFFDLPNQDERKAVWDLWKAKFKLDSPIPSNEEGWTPRNIHDCCMLAWRLKCSLEKASGYIVPVIRSAPQRIEALRKQANERFLSASQPGIYKMPGRFSNEDAVRAIQVTSKLGDA